MKVEGVVVAKPIHHIHQSLLLFDASFPWIFFHFDQTLTANKSGLKPLNLENSHIVCDRYTPEYAHFTPFDHFRNMSFSGIGPTKGHTQKTLPEAQRTQGIESLA